jgi:DDE family transposase
MIFATSLPAFKSFLGETARRCADFSHVVACVACILLPAVARRSVKAAARSIRAELRDAGNLLRFLGGSASPAALLAAAQRRLLGETRQHEDRLHLLLLDSTQHGQEGRLTENTYSCRNTKSRPKKSSRKQKKTQKRSCHCFVFALLLCPCGTRVPYWLPFHTKEYCRLRGWEHRTQADLAARLITELPLPQGVPLVVVGDTAFEAKQVRRACRDRDARWVVPVNPERRLATAKPRPKVLSLAEGLRAQDFRRVSFRLDEGELAPMARVSPGRIQSSKHQRVYWVHQRTADVLSVGQVVLLFSNKQDPSKTPAVRVQKVLMSDALHAGAEELLRWYALRWQVEQFFKEMKGELGMGQYKTKHFSRVQGWVTLCVLSLCYLEWRRRQLLTKAGKQQQPYWRAARAHALRARLRQEVEQADLAALLRTAQSARGRKRLSDLLKNGYDDPADPRGRRCCR